MPKFIFVTGGVVSSLGKGITAASIGRILKGRGIKVTILKFDPYINVDPGTMSPLQHGEVFVTADGAETDLDLGHYERFIDLNLTRTSNVTAGMVYATVIGRERRGDFLGATVQVIPHITDEIKDRVHRAAEQSGAEVIICEIGGTVGDIEGLPFLEAIRQIRTDVGRGNVLYVHVTLVPHLEKAGELKTKPTQHSVKEIRSIGIHPNIVICRTERALPREVKAKIALFCDVEPDAVIQNPDADTIYEVPLLLQAEGLGDLVIRRLELPCREADLADWKAIVQKIKNPSRSVEIAIVGKYVALRDAYLSVVEALTHAGIANDCRVRIRWIDSEDLERDVEGKSRESFLEGVSGIIIPGGFGWRGVEGKLAAVAHARNNRIPYLGLCLGMQAAVVEFARNCCGMEGANSSEFDPDTPYPVIDLLPEQREISEKGGTMRLGTYPCVLEPGSLSAAAYGAAQISERHRHRYEFNNSFREQLQACGLRIAGTSPDGRLVEIIELHDHPWFVGTQFHPEFTSRPNRPQPLFNGFIAAALAHAERQAGDDGASGRGRDGSSTPLDQAGSPQGFARVTQP